MPRQISDEEWNYYQGRTQIANFAESIFNDPTLNKESRALVKRKYPNLDQGPYDVELRLGEQIESLKKEREGEKQKAKEDADKEKWAKARSKTQQEYNFTEEGMKELEKLMVDENIGSYEAAALLRASRNPQVSTPTMDSRYWQHERQDAFKDIAKDPEGWMQSQIHGAIVRDQQRAKGGR